MEINEAAFKAYDIRGRVPEEVNSELANAVGRAFADFLPKGSIAVGYDMRPDSRVFAENIIKGAVRQGRKVFNLGMCPTDALYFGVAHLECVGGAMVTASHNPAGYNGIKLTAFKEGFLNPIGIESGLEKIKTTIINDSWQSIKVIGDVKKMNILKAWVNHALKFSPKLQPLKVGMDFGNGMAGILLEQLKTKTPLQIKALYELPDGNFPNHPADPLQEKNLSDLKKLVKSNNLDVGIAFDGDGDRVVIIDDTATRVDPSIVGALIAQHILSKNPGRSIIYNITASRLLVRAIRDQGGRGFVSKTGHSYMKSEMIKHKAIFGAESSGHYYFSENFNADSGLIAALSILQSISDSGKKLSELCKPFRKEYFQSGEINFRVKDKKAIIEKIASEFSDGKQDFLDGLTVNYPDWWFNVRPSNTEPLLRLNVEAKNQQGLNKNLTRLKNIIKGA